MSGKLDYASYRALIVGCGSIGRRHRRNLRSMGLRDIGVDLPELSGAARRGAEPHLDLVQRAYTRTCKVADETGTALP